MLGKGPVWALGAVSGTSGDGVAGAMVRTDGVDIFEFGKTGYRAYSDQGRAVLGQWLGQGAAQVSELVENCHAELLSGFEGAELVGFHGQTLPQSPKGQATFGAGNGTILAEVLGVPVVWDFQSSDIEAGGQGRPLAPFFHFACARWINASKPLVFLNLGGVGRVTWLDPTVHAPEHDGALLAFDTGPANCVLDDFLMARRGQPMDKNGELAARGNVVQDIVNDFLQTPYFHRIPPKSFDQGEYASLKAAVEHLNDADGAATLTAVAVACVVKAGEHFPAAPSRVLVAGGGRHNPVMMAMLRAGLNCPVDSVEAVGLNGDMLEAQAFAYLAVRVVRGLPTSCPATTGVGVAIGGGKISRPARRYP